MREITDMVLSTSELKKSGMDSAQSNNWVPKSWFTDPFALLDSLGLGYKSSPTSISFETLKQMSERNTIIAAIIQTRVQQVASFCHPQQNKYSIGFKITHRDENKRLDSEELSTIKYLEDFILNCGGDYNEDRDDFENYIKKVVRDRLTYDQVATEIVYKYSGKPHSFFAVPGSTIRLAAPKKNKGTPLTIDENKKDVKYVQVIDGAIVNTYTPKEMAFSICNPRTDIRAWGYGYSELEMLITTVTAHLYAEDWNRRQFTQGSTTKGILNLRGNIPPQQLDAFKRQWLAQVSGVSNAWRTPIINSNEEIQWISLQPTNQEMGYAEWMNYLIKVSCAIYLIDPAEINFDLRGGSGANRPMFMSTNESQQKLSQDKGLRPLIRHIAKHINRNIIWRIDPRYVFSFAGVDAKTEAEAIELRMKELQSYMTLNEVRKREQLPPVAHGDVVPNPSYIGYRNQKEMMEQQQQMMAQQQGGGMQAPSGQLGDTEKEARNGVLKEIGQKPKGAKSKSGEHVVDRYHSPDEDWEQTVNASLHHDLQKTLRHYDEFLIDNP